MFRSKEQPEAPESIDEYQSQWQRLGIRGNDLTILENYIAATKGGEKRPNPTIFVRQTEQLNEELLGRGFNFTVDYLEMLGVLIDSELINRQHQAKNQRIVSPLEIAVYRRAITEIRRQRHLPANAEIPEKLLAERVKQLVREAQARLGQMAPTKV